MKEARASDKPAVEVRAHRYNRVRELVDRAVGRVGTVADPDA